MEKNRTISFVSRHLEEAFQENSTLPDDLKLVSLQEAFLAPAKFTISFEFFEDNLDKLINV